MMYEPKVAPLTINVCPAAAYHEPEEVSHQQLEALQNSCTINVGPAAIYHEPEKPKKLLAPGKGKGKRKPVYRTDGRLPLSVYMRNRRHVEQQPCCHGPFKENEVSCVCCSKFTTFI